MSRKIVRLTLDNLERAAGAVPLLPVLGARPGPPRPGRGPRAREKDAWVSRRPARVGLVRPGRAGRRRAGRLRSSTRRRRSCRAPAGFPTAPVSPDAVLLTTAYVDPAHAGGGLGRMLVQGMARDLIRAATSRRSRRSATPAAGHASLRAAGGLPRQRRLQDPAGAPHHAADADGPALRRHLAGRGGGGAGAARRRRTTDAGPGAEDDARAREMARPRSRGLPTRVGADRRGSGDVVGRAR